MMGKALFKMIVAALLAGLIGLMIVPIADSFTDSRDVYAINNLYVALGSPSLPGWTQSAGDPCGDNWQGVQCVESNISGIILNGVNLGGQLGDSLSNFTSIITIDLSNNHVGGSIPSNLPLTLQRFFLSANQFMGSIPSSLSSLALLSDMSLNNNLLTGQIPDAFQGLTGLINLDLSFNNLSDQLPPSMGSLSSLTSLHLQNNQISGTLNVLENLPLKDLNIENNLFSGPVPSQMLGIPNFKMDGNPFNTTAPSSQPPAPPPPPIRSPSSHDSPKTSADSPSGQPAGLTGNRKFFTTGKIVGFAAGGVVLFIVAILAIVFLISYCYERNSKDEPVMQRPEVVPYKETEKKHNPDTQTRSSNHIKEVPKEAVEKQMEDGIDMTDTETFWLPPPPPPPPPPPLPLPVKKVTVNPVAPTEKAAGRPTSKKRTPISATPFSVASLQQFTNSFGPENLIGEGSLGKVYRAELPDGKLLAVKKIDNSASVVQTDDEFLELVSNISRLRHVNIVELVGYCAEHGQRLLVYEYCSNGSLHDALHAGETLHQKLSWNARVHMALGAAKALEYLHEVCQPPIVHRSFKSSNVLLDDELSVHISDCGFASLVSSGYASQVSMHLHGSFGYSAPEFDLSGLYTYQSDVYSFGVVMLELLTGRKAVDRSRPRAEQSLVRWATPRLHDIDALSRMVDPALNGTYPAKSLSRFADIISLCVQSEPEFRPPISEIVQKLLVLIQREPPSKNRSNGGPSNVTEE